MAWESPLDRLVVRQTHLAEKNEVKVAEVRDQVLDLMTLAPRRFQSTFHVGYAGTLLGIQWPHEIDELAADQSRRRWFHFGKMRAHERRGERSWVSDICENPDVLSDLFREPALAAQCLPIVVRNFFWTGDLGRAVSALELLSVQKHEPEDGKDTLLEAALNDLIARIERRDVVEENGPSGTREILRRCMAIRGFSSLIPSIRARYHRALASVHLASGDWDDAERELVAAVELSPSAGRLSSSSLLMAAMAKMRVQKLSDLVPEPKRRDRASVLGYLDRACADDERCAPEALFARGILAYEEKDLTGARRDFERALKLFRRAPTPDEDLLARARFYLGASILASGARDEARRAAHLLAQSLDQVSPDLETFYSVHGPLKDMDRSVALRFLDRVDIGRGTSAEQLLMVALEYHALGEAGPAETAARRVLSLATNLDHRVEALKILLAAHNMRGADQEARETYYEIRDLYLRRGMFKELEILLKNEALVGQALDHLTIKNELIDLYDEMEGHESERVALQLAVARSFRARKDVEQLKHALGILREVEVRFPDLAREDLETVEKLLAVSGAEEDGQPRSADRKTVLRATEALGHTPRILVVGGNERQRKHHPKFDALKTEWGFAGEWLMANYTSPQRLVHQIAERLQAGLDGLVLLHWNRHETTEPALELARKHGVPARTVYYAGFTSLQVALAESFSRMAATAEV